MTKKILTALMSVLMWAAATQAQSDSTHKNLNLDIEGMTCDGCAPGVANATKQLDGVTKAEINFDQKTGAFIYDSSKVTENKIIQAISKAGFKASVKKSEESATLNISGMTCQLCANSVEKALTQIDGVKGAKVSLTNNQANVTFNSSKVSLDTLIAAVSKAGGDRHSFKAETVTQLACEFAVDSSSNTDSCCATPKIKIQ